MKRILLDTSAYSYLMRGSIAVSDILDNADEVFLSAIVIGELFAGFKRGGAEKKNIGVLKEFMSVPHVEILPLDDATAERYAVILDYLRKQGTPIPTNDIWIAASAMQHGLSIVSGDKHFSLIPHVITENIAP